jgi:stage III sporulation protein AG
MENISCVEVMITTLDEGESVTLKDSEVSEKNQDNTSEKSEKETTVYGQGESGEEPFVTQYKKPEVLGVVVCCKGGNEGDNSLKITKAVQALFDVPAHKIVVLEAN